MKTIEQIQAEADAGLEQEAAERGIHKRDLDGLEWAIQTPNAKGEYGTLLDGFQSAQECQDALNKHIAECEEAGEFQVRFYAYCDISVAEYEYSYDTEFTVEAGEDWRADEAEYLRWRQS